jgi:hypothetical protein
MTATTTALAPRPPHRRWWPWVVAALLLVGGGWVWWYDHALATYRGVGKSQDRYWCRETGVMLQEGKHTFIFCDLDGGEKWRVVAPATNPGKRAPADAAYIRAYEAGSVAAVSPDGHTCAIAMPDDTWWAVHTWRDGKPLGVARVQVPFDRWGASVCCADNGNTFFRRTYAQVSFLIRGDHVVAQGNAGEEYTDVSPDGSRLISAQGDGSCAFGRVMVKGKSFSVAWGATRSYDGRYGRLFAGSRSLLVLGRGEYDVPVTFAPSCWDGEGYQQLGKRARWTATVVPGATQPILVTDTVTVYHRDTKAGWSIALPRETTALAPLADDRHVLVGHGTNVLPPSFLARFRTWPVVSRMLGEQCPSLSVSLCNRSGRCEARLPFRQMVDLCAKPYVSESIELVTASADGSHLVLVEDNDVFFLRADPHPTVWETVTGWLHR